MADGLRKPKPLSFEGNVTLNWKHFAQEVEIFIGASQGENDNRTKANEDQEICFFLWLGKRAALN